MAAPNRQPDSSHASSNRKSSYQVKFEEKRAKEQLRKDIERGRDEEDQMMEKVLTFRDMSHLSYFGMKKQPTQHFAQSSSVLPSSDS